MPNLDLDDVATVLADLLRPLYERVKALESRPEVSWAGTFQRHVSASRSVALHPCGSLWIAQRQTVDPPGTPDSGWKLIVKQGAHEEDRR